jgi:predicted permease
MKAVILGLLFVALAGFVASGLRYLRTRWYRSGGGRYVMLLLATCVFNTLLFGSVVIFERQLPFPAVGWVRLVAAIAVAVVAWGTLHMMNREQRRGNGKSTSPVQPFYG